MGIILFTIPRHEGKNEGKNGHLTNKLGRAQRLCFGCIFERGFSLKGALS